MSLMSCRCFPVADICVLFPDKFLFLKLIEIFQLDMQFPVRGRHLELPYLWQHCIDQNTIILHTYAPL